MLKKLIKYEMRETVKVTVWMMMINILIIILSAVALIWISNGGLRGLDEDGIKTVTMLVFSGYAFLASGVIVAEFIYLMVHYYRTMHGDRAYFSRSLPLSTSQLLAGKVISISIFYVVIYLIWFLGYYYVYKYTTVILFATSQYTEEALEMAKEAQSMTLSRLLVDSLISGAATTPCTAILCALSLALGQLMPKNKAVFGVGFFLAISFALGLIIGMTGVIIGLRIKMEIDVFVPPTWLEAVIILICSVFAFRLTSRLLDRNVDLE